MELTGRVGWGRVDGPQRLHFLKVGAHVAEVPRAVRTERIHNEVAAVVLLQLVDEVGLGRPQEVWLYFAAELAGLRDLCSGLGLGVSATRLCRDYRTAALHPK